MKTNLRLFKLTLLAMLTFLVSCKVAKNVQIQTPSATQTLPIINKCDQPIKYYSEKIIVLKGGPVEYANTEIVINPLTKNISLNCTPLNQSKTSFNTFIESFDCNLSTDMMNGQALYKGYIKQISGETTSVIIKVEINDGNIKISPIHPDNNSEMTIIVSKWEVVNE